MSSENPKGEKEDNGFVVLEMRTEPGFIHKAVQKRLDFVTAQAGLPPDQAPLKLDESAFARLEELSNNSIGLALLALRLTFQRVLPSKTMPCTLTAADIDSLGITTEDLEQLWDDPLRDAVVIEVKPWWEA